MSVASQYGAAVEGGKEADSVSEAAKAGATRVFFANNLAAGAIMLLITLIIVSLGALVGGEFIGALPSDSPFSTAITAVENNAGTSFEIFGIALLGIPAVSILAYLISRLGPFVGGLGIGGGGMGGFR